MDIAVYLFILVHSSFERKITMKPQHLTRLLAALVAVGSASVAFAAEPTISLLDYKQANSAYQDAYLNGQFDMQSGNQAQTSYNLNLSLNYQQVFTSADKNIKVNFGGSGSESRGPNAIDPIVSNYQATGAVTADMYFEPNSNTTFWYGKGQLGLLKGTEKPYTTATVGMGYGRVVNVTPMAKAIRLVEALMERNLLKTTPSIAAYQAAAAVIAREPEYVSKYGSVDYHMNWVQDIEKAFGISMDVKSAIKSYDVLSRETISSRKSGWLVRAGVGAVLSNYDGTNGKPALEVGAEYHQPIDNKTQFSDEALLTSIIDSGNNSYHFTNMATLTYQVSDRIDWENSWLLDQVNNQSIPNVTSNTLGSTFRYYISNALSFTVTASLSKLEDGISNNGNDEVNKRLQMGLTYRLK